MSARPNQSVTLTELIIAITILGLIVIGITNLELFSHFQLTTTQRRSVIQNALSYVLEHMAKEISRAIGDINQPAVDTLSGISSDSAIKVWIDYNGTGTRDAAVAGDRQIAYRFTGISGLSPNNYQIRYYANYVNPSSSYEIISRNITAFTITPTDNYVDVQITACWDPDQAPLACGDPDNPAIQMQNRITMPSVSFN